MMKSWWRDLTEREQLLVAAGAGCIALFILVQFIILPAHAFRADAMRDFETQQRNLDTVKAGVVQATRTEREGADVSAEPLQALIARSARRFNLNVASLQQTDGGTVDVVLPDANPTAVYRWVLYLQEEFSAEVTKATLRGNDASGTVRAQISIDGGAS